MKEIFKIVFVIIGTLIGAGFASGQEIYLFFYSYGIKGLFSIIISSLLIGYVIYKVLNIVKGNTISNYKEFLDILIKREHNNKYFNFKYIINIIINIFILISFFIMIAGFGAYLEQEFGINSIIGSIILAVLTFFVLMGNVNGVIKVNTFLIPLLIIFIILIGIIGMQGANIQEIKGNIIDTKGGNWLLSGITYASYNSILLIPILLTLKNHIKTKKQIFNISLLATIIVTVLSVVIYILLTKIDIDISMLEMPIVYVVTNISTIFKYIYGFIILSAIFTTSISLGTSFLQNTSKNRKSYTQIAVIMCITSVLISKIGFSNLVNLLYPIFGYLGIVQIVKISIIKKRKNKV